MLHPQMHERMMNGSIGNKTKSTASTPSLRATTPTMAQSSAIEVSVRVRSFLPREIERGARCLIEMDEETQQTRLLPPDLEDLANARSKHKKITKTLEFAFDNSFWSHDSISAPHANQHKVYTNVAAKLVDAAFEGFNTCIFAYGQTGSGKSYTMMGTPEHPGVIPRVCADLCERMSDDSTNPFQTYHLEVSYYEIYNEKVYDLLSPRSFSPNEPGLPIRTHPVEGFLVAGLREVRVKTVEEIRRYMEEGDSRRTTASTKMNDASSRSHAIFTLKLKQIYHDTMTDINTVKTAKMNLIDLAGCESARTSGAEGIHLKEGAMINLSLTTLSKVMTALSTGKGVVPFRDSALTKILKASLSGNSKTAILACISPADYEETARTLHWANNAKKIHTRAKINSDSTSKAERDQKIAEMAEKIRYLERKQLASDAELHQKARERMQEYQETVGKMMQTHEYASEALQNKMRAVEAENETLKAHLRIAIAEIKNPIVLPAAAGSGPAPFSKDHVVWNARLEDAATARFWTEQEAAPGVEDPHPRRDRVTAPPEEQRVGASDAAELQGLFHDFVQYTALFRKKLLNDMDAFDLEGREHLVGASRQELRAH